MAEVLSLYELAQRFRLSTGWIKSLVKAGTIPYLKAGRRLLFNPAAVSQALAQMAAMFPGASEFKAADTTTAEVAVAP
jgi:excisionase family DNA binding protein